MGNAKKHHYVPRAYLKYFAVKSGNAYMLNTYDKKTKKKYLLNVNDAAQARDYNLIKDVTLGVKLPEGDDLYYEKLYNDVIESKIPIIINNVVVGCKLIRENRPVITHENKRDLARLLVTQLYRTPLARKMTYELGIPIYENTMQRAYLTVSQLNDSKRKKEFMDILNKFEYNDEFVKSLHLDITMSPDRINNFIDVLVENHCWIVYDNVLYSTFPFVTSDNPVTMYNVRCGSFGFEYNGLNNISTVISMPLTPRYQIALYHKQSLIGMCLPEFDGRSYHINEPDFVFKQNMMHVEQSYRQVYLYG